MRIAAFLTAAVLLAAPRNGVAGDIQMVAGRCEAGSHIADGGINEDLRKRESRFFCDMAVISFYPDNPHHIQVQFADHKSNHDPILGFAGMTDSDGIMLTVNHVYLEPGKAVIPVDGHCKFFFKRKHMDSIVCGARIEEGDRATVPVVVFQALPGQ